MLQRLRTMFKPEPLTQTVVPGQVGTAVWPNGLDHNPANYSNGNSHFSGLDHKSNLSLDGSFKENKTFSPTAKRVQPFQCPQSRLSRYHYQRRRPRPPTSHRVSASSRFAVVTNAAGGLLDQRSRAIATDALQQSYYSDEDSASYYYIDQAMPYEQWKQLLLRQSSLCEIASSPSSLALATEWLV